MGVPGLAKTLLAAKWPKHVAEIQPTSITPTLDANGHHGTDILQAAQGGQREFQFVHGHCNLRNHLAMKSTGPY